MRQGQNPAKFVNKVAIPERITVAVLNYIPFQSGFYAEMLDVLKTCLNSIRTTADLPFDLLVFDNGSCPEVQHFLLEEQQRKAIQYLMLSDKNLGKGGAWNIILEAAPGEIIAYTDNDVLFSKTWLSRSIQILETYPKVGMVTARPFRTKAEYYSSSLKWAKSTKTAEIAEGSLIPWESFLEFNLSIATPEKEIKHIYETTQDYLITYKGVKAFIGASHWQFIAYKKVLKQFLPFSMDKPMGQVKLLDQKMNTVGFLRLMVSDPLAMNMSNSVPETLRKSNEHKRSTELAGMSTRILEFKPVKSVLMKIYNKIFKWYYGN
jgi:glycosyltransferase involved in cell wall biosynthesis